MGRWQKYAHIPCLTLLVLLSGTSATTPKRIDLLYLDAQLLTCSDPPPPALAPILTEVAKQPTWTHSVGLLTQEQANALVSACSTAPAPIANFLSGTPARTTIHPPTTAPTDPKHPSPQFTLAAGTGTVDAQGSLPLRLRISASARVTTADPRRPMDLAWSANLGIAIPLEQPLLIDLGPSNPAAPKEAPSRALVLLTITTHAPPPRDDPATRTAPGDLYRAYARTTLTCNQITDSLRVNNQADAIKQVTYLRGQLYPVLTSPALPPDLASAAGPLAVRLDTLIAHLRDQRTGRANETYTAFLSEWRELHYRVARNLSLP